MKKTVYTLNIGNYAPGITEMTYPYLKGWAEKIGAEFVVITERKFPKWPVTFEKLQVHELSRTNGDDWSIFIDSDALVHPETVDFTEHLPMDTVAHNGSDFANVRWQYDDYFRRDGRNIGSCTWLCIASRWCRDLWRPLDDLSLDEALARINPTPRERSGGITREHLIDDFTMSRNIARYGLKFKTVRDDLLGEIGLPEAEFFWHIYAVSIDQKVAGMKETMKRWGL